MARAAVKAKQAQKAQAQVAAKPSRAQRGQRGHASGGNPNQDLFFTRLRRRQKWVFLLLAVMFAISFVALGVGSGAGGGLSQSIVNYVQGVFGNSNDAVAKANKEIKTNPKKGYQDLAKAYITQGNLPAAITTLKQYLKLKKTDSAAWTQLAGYETTQADTYSQQYRAVLQSVQQQTPGTGITLSGTLQGLFPKSPIDDYYAQQSQAQLTPLYQNASSGYTSALDDYKKAAQYAKQSGLDESLAQQRLALAAQNAGQPSVALTAWQRYIELKPHSPKVKQIEAYCKQQLHGSCVPKHTPAKHKKK